MPCHESILPYAAEIQALLQQARDNHANGNPFSVSAIKQWLASHVAPLLSSPTFNEADLRQLKQDYEQLRNSFRGVESIRDSRCLTVEDCDAICMHLFEAVCGQLAALDHRPLIRSEGIHEYASPGGPEATDLAARWGDFGAGLRRRRVGRPFASAEGVAELARGLAVLLGWADRWNVPLDPSAVGSHVHEVRRWYIRKHGEEPLPPALKTGPLLPAEAEAELETLIRWLDRPGAADGPPAVVQAALDFILAHPFAVAKEIACAIDVDESHFRRSIVPQLKALGVKSKQPGYCFPQPSKRPT